MGSIFFSGLCFNFLNASRLLGKGNSKYSRLNKTLALQKFCFTFARACCNAMTGSVEQEKSVGFTFPCFLGVPILGSDLWLSPPCFGSGFAGGQISCSTRSMGCPAALQVLRGSLLLGLSPQQASL